MATIGQFKTGAASFTIQNLPGQTAKVYGAAHMVEDQYGVAHFGGPSQKIAANVGINWITDQVRVKDPTDKAH